MTNDTQQQSISALFQCYKEHLTQLIASESLQDYIHTNAQQDPLEALLDTFVSSYIHVEDFINHINTAGVIQSLENACAENDLATKQIIIAPCSPLFSSILEQLEEKYDNITFIDSNRAGLKIGNKTILSPNEDSNTISKGKELVCLILTRNTEAIAYYQQQFGYHNCIDLLAEYIVAKREHIMPETKPFVSKLNQTDKALLFASARPMGTLTSTIQNMAQDGYQTFWLGAEEVKETHQTGYSTPKTKDMGFADFTIGGFIDTLYIFSQMRSGTALFHFEALYPPAWDFARIAICYAGTLALIRTIKECRIADSQAKLALYMYDAIKPGVKNYHAGDACARLYKMMMLEAEAVVFSSYTEKFGDFVENSISKKLLRCHCHRYQVVSKRRQQRRQDGYHIAIISVLLEEFWEPSRMGLVAYIRNIMAQGIHIHYYVSLSSWEKITAFKDSLARELQPFFHMHTPIHNPEELAYELSQYHAGWSLFNMQIFSDMIANLKDQFMRDAMEMFTPTTLPSVIWSCAAAGLPIICNRSMQGVVDMLPEGMTIPLTCSELGNLKPILDALDWDKINQTSLESLDISNQIGKLYDFLEQLNDA